MTFNLSSFLISDFSKVTAFDHPKFPMSSQYFAVFEDTEKFSKFLGLVTLHDVVNHPNQTFGHILQTAQWVPLSVTTTLTEAIDFLNEHKVLVAPLLNEQQLFLGLVTLQDLLKFLQEQRIENLEKKIDKLYKKIKNKQNEPFLSGLPYAHLRTKITQLINENPQNSKLALLNFGLDQFRSINTSWGAEFGDLILKKIIKMIINITPKSNFTARKWGDEFIIIVPDVKDIALLTDYINDLLTVINKPFKIKDKRIRINCSVGVSLYPDDAEGAETLLSHAYSALCRIKEIGGNCYHFYHSDLEKNLSFLQDIKTYLPYALEQNQFTLYYQPQYNIQTNEIFGVEALLRWNHPRLGFIEGKAFIEILQADPNIIMINDWIINTACLQLKMWQKNHPNLRLSINLATPQLLNNIFTKYSINKNIQTILQQLELDPKYLELEINEGLFCDPYVIKACIVELKKLGVRISCDDFGINCASFNRIRDLSLDTLKIDQSLIRDMPNNPAVIAILKGILSITKELQIESIAEGVENASHIAFLKNLGCDAVQGYYISPPLSPEKCTEFLNKPYLLKKD